MLLAYAYLSKPEPDYVKAETELTDITKMNYALMDDYADVFDPAQKNNKESIFEVQYKSGNEGQHSDYIWRFIPKTTNTEVILGLHGTNLRGGITSGGWNVPTQEWLTHMKKMIEGCRRLLPWQKEHKLERISLRKRLRVRLALLLHRVKPIIIL
jgi:hypothetical protein